MKLEIIKVLFLLCTVVPGSGYAQIDTLKSSLSIDTFNSFRLYKESFSYYDSLGLIALKTSDRLLYVHSLVGKGVCKRYDHQGSDYHEALNYFNEALIVAKKLTFLPDGLSALLYYHLATTERVLINYNNAESYITLAMIKAEELGDRKFIARCYHAQANILVDQKKYEEAIKFFQRAVSMRTSLEMKNDDILPLYLNNLAITYRHCMAYKKSNEVLDKALHINRKLSIPDTSIVATAALLKAFNHCDLGDFNQTKIHYDEFKSIINAYKFDTIGAIANFWNMGRIQVCIGNLDSALQHFQNALIASFYNFSSMDITASPQIDERPLQHQLISREDIYDVLNEKGTTLLELYRNTEKIEYLRNARSTYRLAHQIMMRQRLELNEVAPSLHIAEHGQVIYENALDNLFELYLYDNTSDIFREAFKYMESNKQVILLKNKMINDHLEDNQGIVKKLNEAQYKIDKREQAFKISKNDNDQISSVQLLEEIIDLKILKNATTDTIDLIEKPFMFLNVELADVQNLVAENGAVVSFFWGKRYVFILGISGETVFFDRKLSTNFEQEFQCYLKALKDPSGKSSIEDYKSFVSCSSTLYDTIIAPFINSLNIELYKGTLIVVPDGKLNKISFAALLTSSNRDSSVNYKMLDYLGNNVTLNYAFSIANYVADINSSKSGSSFLGFAHDHLPGSQKEVDRISSFWKGDRSIYHGKFATESAFKSEVSEYDIIHLATHARIGTNENNSILEFMIDSSSQEDGKLYNYEIYPLSLKARLVTLSACESGLGADVIGEGIYSLARGFNYAGSPTIIMSLWDIDDVKTASLMPDVYSEMILGFDISKSLQNAQLNYLSNASATGAHPFYWAGLVLIGDGTQVLFPGNGLLEMTLIVFGLILLGAFILYCLKSIIYTRSVL